MSNIFNPNMLTLARESRGLTQSELARKTGMQQSIVSKIEQGFRGISPEEIHIFCEKLDYPESFFYQTHVLYPPNSNYRKKLSITSRQLNKVEAMMNIYRANIHLLLKSVELPEKRFPVISHGSVNPIQFARQLRSFWNLPKGPINNLTALFESKGIIIVLFDFGTEKIDGRSMTTQDGHPIIFLNRGFSGDRLRITLAHEGGHIFMHLSGPEAFDKTDKEKEDEAWLFALEFMIPQTELLSQMPPRLTLNALADLKRYWGISMQAILRTLTSIGAVSDSQSRYLWSQISAKGYRKSEPVEIEKEVPTLITEIIQSHSNDLEYSNEQLADMLCLHMEEFEHYYLTDKPKLKIIR